MTEQRIAFIGGGNMARSLIGGLIADGFSRERLIVSEPDEERRKDLRALYEVQAGTDNRAAAAQADTVVIAVKPQVAQAAAREIAPAFGSSGKLVISIAAGIRTRSLESWLGGATPIIRAMPNTPALVQSGATALFATTRVSQSQREQAESILRAVGLTLWLEDEDQMDAVTALSGSGPAYFFLVMEALESAGRELGLPAATARLLTLQTAFGAAKMALESDEASAVLRARVTSPGGTTERAIGVLQQGRLQELFEQALQAACARSKELSRLLEDQRD